MPDFSYQAADLRGKTASGQLTAATRAEAMQTLRAQGLIPLQLAETMARDTGISGRKPRRRDVLPFTQQLATLLGAGLQLDRALAVMAELAKAEPAGRMVAALRQDIQEGAAFSVALARHPGLFDRVYINMARAGETGGVLPAVLQRLAQTLEEEQELRSFVLGTLLYPAVVACVGLGAVIFLLTTVVPAFAHVFAQMDQAVPALTRWTMAASRGLLASWLWLLLGLGALGALGAGLSRRSGFREKWDRLYLRLPLLGDLAIKLATARMARTLAMLIKAGVPILQAFAVLKETVRNRHLARAVEAAGREIKEGGGIARRLQAQHVLPPMAIEMIAVGEETGELPQMLEQVAKGYDAETRRVIRNLLSLLEPALILCLTAMTLLIAISILVPIININTSL